MAAPDFVPIDPSKHVRSYTSPPRRNDAWSADRPGDLAGSQPRGTRLGSIGPDQGYAYRLVTHLADQLHLGGVKYEDAEAGCVWIATKRASLYGRAPVVHDLTAAFTIFGFLDANPPAELVTLRETLFAEVRSSHHYVELREIADLVPDEVLKQVPAAIGDTYRSDWRKNLRTPGPGH